MNDPSSQPVDIDEQRNWVNDLHRSLGSWAQVAKRTGVPQGTISSFAAGTYQGRNENVAEKVVQYRQFLTAQQQIEVDMPKRPGYYETPTSREMANMLTYAQRFGRIVLAAMGPGLGKTETARQYKAAYPNVFHAVMTPSTAGVNNMQIEVLEACGELDAKGTPQRLSRRIKEKAANLSNMLIIIDEAQHLSEKAIEEIRGWNDATGVGIALFGNESVLQRLEGGSRRAAFAQLYSRLGLRIVRSLPQISDIDAMAYAWGITDETLVAFLRRIGRMPGGLRGATHTVELALMVANSAREPLAEGHLQDAWTQLSARAVAA